MAGNNVYIIKSINNIYKIGVSKDIKKRLSSLQSANFELLQIHRTFKCKTPYVMEKDVHKKFNRFRKRGEWFVLENIEIVEQYMNTVCQTINGDKINYVSNYNKHMKIKHINHIQSKIFECRRCGKGFDKKYNLERHLKKKIICKIINEVEIKQVKHKCKYCKKTFHNTSNLNKHQKK